MGNAWSRSYSPNPIKKGIKCCPPCSCSPFCKINKDGDDIPMEIPKPPIYNTDDKDDKIPKDTPLLTVQNIDLQVKSNTEVHHTNEYHLVEKEKPCLVIRRGQPFTIKITFNRSYQSGHDVACLVFTAKDAKNPSYAQMTLVSVPVVEETPEVSKTEWTAKLINNNGFTITLEILIPSQAIVGAWSLDVDTKLNTSTAANEALRYASPDPVYIIFNPWCKDDLVFLDNETKRKEYVLNDNGLIWRGTHSSLRPTPWAYAQFDESVLECAIYILNHVGQLRKVLHNDPIQVVRHLSAVANSVDDDGIIVGNWSSDYSGGQAPTKWGGSQLILQQFYKTKKPVKFGQCWVFSGVLTTICRALGIPCRTVTNFSSAHDTHDSLTVDIFCNEDGDVLNDLSSDSIWNFHVWNEVWMERPDLEPGGYGGWQAIDSTPQEPSDGLYRCGPASIAAVKRGHIKKGFDVSFLFAEVNADKVFWRYRGNTQPLKLLSKQPDTIGLFISTKAVGSYEREDLTNDYKFPERSEEERVVMLNALRQSSSLYSRYYLNDNFEDVEFNFILKDDIVIGESFKVVLHLKNKSSEVQYDINSTLRVSTMLYNGQVKNPVKLKSFETLLRPNTETQFLVEILYEDYENKLEDQQSFHIAAMAKVKQTDFDYFAQDDFRVRMPDIIIDTEGDIAQDKEFNCTVHFKNPLPKSLRKGEFTIEGPGLGSPLKIKVLNNVNAGEDCSASCKLTPKMSGEKTIVAKFTSKELRDVDGFKTIHVKSKYPNSPTPPVQPRGGNDSRTNTNDVNNDGEEDKIHS
ncbi:hypothetical protein CHUAL_005515 [Chamberlinius hualienensis]